MLINVTGGDGAGKTTQVDLLIDWIAAEFGCPVRLGTKGEVLNTERYPEGRMFGCTYHELAEEITNDMLGFSRALFLYYLSAAQVCRHPPAAGEIVILDGYWTKNYATEAAIGVDSQWLIAMGRQFPVPDVTIFLDVAPIRVVPRGLKYKPYECGYADTIDDASFVANQDRVRTALQDEAGRQGWLVVDGDKSIEDVQSDLRKILSSRIAHSLKGSGASRA